MLFKKMTKILIATLMIVTMMWVPSFQDVKAIDEPTQEVDPETTDETTNNPQKNSSQTGDASNEENSTNDTSTEESSTNETTQDKKDTTITPEIQETPKTLVLPKSSADPNGIYISISGHDSTGDGSVDKPFKTLDKAYKTVTSGNTIYLLTDIVATSQTAFNTGKDVTITSAAVDGTPITNGAQAHTLYNDAIVNTISISNGSLTTKNIKFSSQVADMGRAINGSNKASTININEGTTFNDLYSSGYRGNAVYSVGKININANATNPVTFKNVSNAKDLGVISLYGNDASCVMNSTGKEGIIFDACQTTSGGVIRMNAKSTLTINGDDANRDSVVFKNCISNNASGGAISAAEYTTVSMDHVTFENCSCGNGSGGAIYYGGNQMLTVNNCDFSSNTAADRGGAISASIATIDNCTFDKNKAQNGGGVSLLTSTLTNSTFTNNTANDGGGGAYYVLNGGTVANVSNCTFDKNTSVKTGGGIKSAYDAANDPGSLSITDCKVTNNTCTSTSGRGGGIYASTNTNIKGCQVTSNISAGNGGGIYAYQGYYHRTTTITITDSDAKATVISNNTAASGGGIFEMFISGNNNDCSLNIEGNTSISNNTSSSNGGGISTQSSVSNTTIKINIKDDVRIMGNTSNVGNGGGIYQNKNTTVNMSGNAVVSGNSCGSDKLGGGVYNANTLTKGMFTVEDNVQIVNNLINHDSDVKNNYTILNGDALSKDQESTHYGIYVAGALGDNAAIHVNPVYSEKGVLIAKALDESTYAIADSDQEKFYNDQISNGVIGAYPIHFDTTDITGNVNNLILYGTLYNVEHYYGIASMDDRVATDTADIDTQYTGNALTKAEYTKKDKYGYKLNQITYQEDSSSTETPTTTEITVPSQDGLVIRLYYEKENYNVTFKAEDEDFIKVKDGDPQIVDYEDKAVAGTTYETVHPGKEFFTGWLYTMEVDGKTITGVVMDYTTVKIQGKTTFTATYSRVPFLSINSPVGGSVSIQKGNNVKYIEDGTHIDKYEFDKDDEGPYVGTGAFRADKNYHVSSITVIFPNEDGTSSSYVLDLSNNDTQSLGTGNVNGTAKLTINDNKTYGKINITANSSAMIIVQYEEDPTYKITYIANYSASDNTEVAVKNGKHTGDVVGGAPTESLYLPGYRLVGWSTTRINGADSNYVNNYDENTEVGTSDITYYAIWESIGQYEYDMIVYLEDANGHFVESTSYSTIRSVASANSWVYLNHDEGGSIKNERNIIGYTYDKANTSNVTSFYFDSSDPDLAYQHVSLKSYYRLNRFKVNYVLNNGEANIVQNNQIFNSKITPPSDPTRNGYTFMGFYEDESFVQKADFDSYSMPNNDVTFYARWKPNTHELIFEYNGATGGNSLENKDITFDNPYDTLPTPTKAGYTFSGWFAEAELTTQVDATTVFSQDNDITIYAKWTANTNTGYKVEHYKENVNGTYTKADTDDLTGTTATTVSATAKSYTGYTLTTTSDTVASGTITGDGKLVLKLYYKLNSYSVKFDANGGTGTAMSNESFKYTEEKKLTKNTYTRAGYDFKGWSTTKTGSVVYDDEEEVSKLSAETDGEVTIYAVWEQREDTTYKVEHYKENVNGTYTKADTDDLTGTTATTVSATAKSYTGYTLTTTSNTVASGTITGDGKLVLKLYYNLNSYNVKFDANGGTGTAMSNESFKYTEEKKLTKNTYTRAGYNFKGWSTTKTGSVVYDDEKQVSNLTTEKDGVVTIYAVWAESSDAIIKYVAQTGGTVSLGQESVAPISGTPAGSTATANAGYSFDGWYDGSVKVSSNKQFEPVKTNDVFEAKTYTAHFKANDDTQYKVEYYIKDLVGTGYTLDSTENKTGTTDTAASSTKKSIQGCAYEKITYEATGEPASPTALTISGDGRLVIKYYYTRNQYNVKFIDPSEGTLTADDSVKNQSVTFGGSPTGTLTVTPPSDEYLWLGFIWKDTTNGTTGTISVGDAYKSFVVKGNTELTPYFAHIPFSAITTEGNGAVIASKKPNPTLANDVQSVLEYTSIGSNPDTLPYNSYMEFKANEHYKVASITIETPNGTDKTQHSISLDATTVNPADLPAGLLDTSGSVKLDMATNGLSGSLTISHLQLSHIVVIKYEIIKHEVSFDLNGGTSSSIPNQTIDDGKKVSKPQNPTRKGYSFAGWKLEGKDSDYDFDKVVTSDLKLVAQWKENKVTLSYSSEDTTMGTVTPIKDNDYSETIGCVTGKPVGSTAKPLKGYDFVGWYKGSQKVSDDLKYVPTQTNGLYETADFVAKFMEHQYTLTIHYVYEDNSPALGDYVGKVEYQSSYLVNSPEIVGYTANPAKVSGKMTEDTTVTVKYTPNKDTPYSVYNYYQDLDGTYPSTPSRVDSKTGTTHSTPKYPSHDSDGFAYDASKTTFEDKTHAAASKELEIAADGSLIIKLYYNRLSYTLSFDGKGADNVAEINALSLTGKYQSVIKDIKDFPKDPIKAGYTFSGWSYIDKDGKEVIVNDSSKLPSYDIKLTANWEKTGTSISGKDNEISIADGQLTPTDVLKKLDVVATDASGNKIDLSDLVVDKNQLDALNQAIANKKPGVYEITVTAPDGTSKVFKVTLVSGVVVDSGQPTGDKDTGNKDTDDKTHIDTGDNVNMMNYIYLAGMSLICGFILIFKRKKEDEE